MEAGEGASAELEGEASLRFALGESQENMIMKLVGDPDGFSCRQWEGAGIRIGRIRP